MNTIYGSGKNAAPVIGVTGTATKTNNNATNHITPRLRGDRCQCAGCGEYFNSTAAFDKHRAGSGIYRRCLTINEMLKTGMVLTSQNLWVTRPSLPVPTRKGAAIDAAPCYHQGVQI